MLLPSALAVALASAATLSSAQSGWGDDLAMVQQRAHGGEPRFPRFSEYDEGMRMWLRAFYSMMRQKGDMYLIACCDMAKALDIVPYESWGSATPEQQRWWEENSCNFAVGADEPDVVVGIPSCPQPNELTSMLPAEPLALQRDSAESDGPGCTVADRAQLNMSFTDRSKLLFMKEPCAEYHLIRDGVKWDSLTDCIGGLHGISTGCAACYSGLFKDIGGTNLPSKPACLTKCMPLGACHVISDCGSFISECAECVQPVFQDYARCLGGPVYNQLRMQQVFEGMILYHPGM